MGYWEIIWKSFVLGAVQGLTEFLPVSSSGHLTLLQKMMHFDLGGTLFFNVMLHFGTLVAVCTVFFKDILALFKRPFKPLLMLIVATIPAGVVGILLNDKIDGLFAGENAFFLLAICFLTTAMLLLVCELVAKSPRRKERDLGWRNAVPMGLMQAVALFPGISRSGSTIVAGTVSGAKPKDVAKFSFLMSIPVILGSFAVELFKFVKTPDFGGMDTAKMAVGVLVGVITAAVFGFFAIKLMLKVISKANYKWFAFYLILLSAACIWFDVLGLFA